jgi:hypothetical protein
MTYLNSVYHVLTPSQKPRTKAFAAYNDYEIVGE